MSSSSMNIQIQDKLTPFGHEMRKHFLFSPSYKPLNHGSFGAFPSPVRVAQRHWQDELEQHPDTYIRYTYPPLLDKSRKVLADLVNVDVDEVVLVPNATTATNTVLRGIKWEEGDVIVYFETVYGALEKTVEYVCETTLAESEKVDAEWPISDEELLQAFEKTIQEINEEDKGKRRVRIALFDTICSLPGVRMPWERLVEICREHGVLSCIDGAHGVGQIPLDLGCIKPDFFCSNLHKWLFTPRGCALFYVPFRNQDLIRSSVPTSHGFVPLPSAKPSNINNPFPPSSKSRFVYMHEFIGTTDDSPYLCIPTALEFREKVCGGEEAIMRYCHQLAAEGGKKAADILGTEIMDNPEGTLTRETAFTNILLPLNIVESANDLTPLNPRTTAEHRTSFPAIPRGDVLSICQWMAKKSALEHQTFLAIIFYKGRLWWRLSAQVYLEVEDIVWGAVMCKKLCGEIVKGTWREEED